MIYVVPEIFEQGSGGSESIGEFILADVFMVPFTCFIIVAQHTSTIDNKGKPILETVFASRNEGRQMPHYHFNEYVFREGMALVEQ